MLQGQCPSCCLYAANLKLTQKAQPISVEILHLLRDPSFPYRIYDSSHIYYKNIIAWYAMIEFNTKNFLP